MTLKEVFYDWQGLNVLLFHAINDKMEKGYWDEAGLNPQGARWHLDAGRGMGETLTMAGELRAYTLSDRGTFATYRDRAELDIVVEGDPRMFNPYGIIAVNPKRHPSVYYDGAVKLIEWITSHEGQELISRFRVEDRQLFFPDALPAGRSQMMR